MASYADGELILKADFMMKRSLLRTWHARENYKNRWIILTPRRLKYCGGKPDQIEIKKEKGALQLSKVRVVEYVEDEALGMPNTFQIEYNDNGSTLCLYIIANFALQREQWVEEIKKACIEAGARLSRRYHPGAWLTKTGTFSCCDNLSRQSRGCQNTPDHKNTNTQQQTAPRRSPPPTPTRRRDKTDSQHSSGSDGTSSSSRSESPVNTGTVVVAIYNYNKVEDGDLDLVKGQEYDVLDESSPHWWKVRNSSGEVGHVPVNFTRMISSEGLERYGWYYRDITRPQCERLLHKEGREGCFILRKSSQTDLYTLSIYCIDTKHEHGIIKHYYIRQDDEGQYFLKESQKYASIPLLINFHKNNSAGLQTRLKGPPSQENNYSKGEEQFLREGQWRIDEEELSINRLIGKGQFATVHLGQWKNKIDVAIKILKEDSMSKDDFLLEAETMSQLQHQNLVQLYGICYSSMGLYIVTEYMPKGDLLSYLVKHRSEIFRDQHRSLDMVSQVAYGMQFLESKGFIHRDLAARNCLVGADNTVKIADFGLARFVKEDDYPSSTQSQFPVRWAAIEVLQEVRFSTKSDVWSFGILMWEIMSGGMVPYGRTLKNVDVYNLVVLRNQRLEKPSECSASMYALMTLCWLDDPAERPTFMELVKNLEHMQFELT